MYVVDSVIGLLLDSVVIFVVIVDGSDDDDGLLVGRRVTNVDLTVEVFIIDDATDADGGKAVVLLSSAETTEKLVVNASSSSSPIGEIVVGSTLIIALVGFGFGRGAFVVSTNEIVVNCSADVVVVLIVDGLVGGFLVEAMVEVFLRDVSVVRRFTAIVVATGFLVVEVVFITVVVAFFDGFCVAGRLVGDSGETDVRTGFLVTEFVFVGFAF